MLADFGAAPRGARQLPISTMARRSSPTLIVRSAADLAKAEPAEQPQRGGVARIDVGLEPVDRQRGEDVGDDRLERLAGEALAPVVGMQDQADLAEAPAASLADRAAVGFDDEVVSLRRVERDHALEPAPGLGDIGMRQAIPVAHGAQVGEDAVQVAEVFAPGAAQQQALGDDTRGRPQR